MFSEEYPKNCYQRLGREKHDLCRQGDLKFSTHLSILLNTYDMQDPKLGTLEKAMAPHSSTLAWKTPWMEEPGRLQSMGLRRVGHD